MRISSFRYLIGLGCRSVWINRVMCFATVGVMTVCLLLTGAALLLSENIKAVVSFLEQQNEVTFWVQEGTTPEQLEELEGKIGALDNILDYRLKTKDEWLNQLMMENQQDVDILLDYLDDNPLIDSYIITIRDLSQLEDTLIRINYLPYKDSVDAPIEVSRTLVALRNVVSTICYVFVVVMAAISVLMVGNTIKLSVYNRRREVNIMKYVGATDMFIRFPFLVEGTILGIISAALSYFGLWLGYEKLMETVAQSTGWFASVADNLLTFNSFSLVLGAGSLVAAVAIGIFGSYIFIRKHLRV